MKRWLLFLLFALSTSASLAQDAWPTRSIRLIVPYPPGGSTDILARLVAQRLGSALGQTIVVENKGGANGVVAASYFAKTTTDDYTLMIASLPIMAVNQYLFKNLGYDPQADFAPLGLIAQTPNVIVVAPALGVKTLADLTARATSSTTPLAYSSSGIGSSGHLLNELLKTTTGAKLIHAPYRGNGPAMAALLAGEVQFTTDNLPQLLPQIRSGNLRALVVTSARRWFQLPDVPTAAESGYPALTSSAWFGLVARAKVSPEVVARVNRELNAMLAQPDFIAKLHEVSFEPMPGTPQDMAAVALRERPVWKKVIETSGATAD
jgi:tripartite-type tricarboxylate transporter receptor subunit TctC